jgi:hypothetical protein
MADNPELVTRIKLLDWAGVRQLWSEVQAGTDVWDPGKAFEYLILRAFDLDGAVVEWPYSVRLQRETVEQIDGVVHVHGLTCLVESKSTAEAVNIEPIAKLRNQLLRRHSAAIGILFSRSGFTDPALTLAQFLAPQSILLWTGGEVDYLLDHENPSKMLLLKYRRAIELAVPDYDIRAEALV